VAIGDAQRQRVAKVLQDHPTPPPNAPGWPLLETAILDNPPGEATLVRPHQQKGLPVVDPERQPLGELRQRALAEARLDVTNAAQSALGFQAITWRGADRLPLDTGGKPARSPGRWPDYPWRASP